MEDAIPAGPSRCLCALGGGYPWSRSPRCWLLHFGLCRGAGDLAAPVTAFQPGGGPGKGEIDGYVDAGDDDCRGDGVRVEILQDRELGCQVVVGDDCPQRGVLE